MYEVAGTMETKKDRYQEAAVADRFCKYVKGASEHLPRPLRDPFDREFFDGRNYMTFVGEVRVREVKYSDYPTVIINHDKFIHIASASLLKPDPIFIVQYTDGLFWINFRYFELDSFEVRKSLGNKNRIRNRDTCGVVHIPTEDLTFICDGGLDLWYQQQSNS